jgi:hypothetical protein
MDSFTDYYALLDVDRDATSATIKAAFKKRALQYHPDVYKGEDAHERMRLLLLAYQTLNDPVARKQYDARRSEYISDGRISRTSDEGRAAARPATTSVRRGASDVTPSARRDRQRYYDFPDFHEGKPVFIDLIEMDYKLSPVEAHSLIQQGMVRGVAFQNEEGDYYCHRCRHHWKPSPERRYREQEEIPRYCPRCHADDWGEYLLLRCMHCCAIFESEQIRYEVGSYTYGKGNARKDDALCPPYELFPLCPYCGTAHWCPSEEERVKVLRQRARDRAARVRMVWIGVAMVVMILVGFIALNVLR